MTPSRLSNLRDLWPHLSEIERELLQEVERLQNQPPDLKLHASCLTIEAAWRTALDAVNRELEQAKERERQLHALMIWGCGCGWYNGANLATCAQCGRTPLEGGGRYVEMDRHITELEAANARLTTRVLELERACQDNGRLREAFARIADYRNISPLPQSVLRVILDIAEAALTVPPAKEKP